jgi:hypothetical protein
MLQKAENIVGEDEDETAALKSMAEQARKYISSFGWCPPIASVYLAYGVGGVIAVYLVKLTNNIAKGHDNELWVVVGDLPSVYLVTEQLKCTNAVLHAYCDLMDDWISKVRHGGDLTDAYPIAIEPSLVNANRLASRIRFVRNELLKN